jgi:hypothetical protein
MQAATQPSSDTRSPGHGLRILLWVLVLLAAAEFIVRGPLRYLREPGSWNDLSQNYTASRLWLRGQSPADPKNFVALWWHEGLSRLDLTDIRTHLAPPLGGLVIMAPIAAFHWKIAKILWLAILLISFAATVWALVRTSAFASNEFRILLFLAACLALAPFQTGIASGNTSILVIALCATAIWAASSRHDIASGILFGMACAMKPQLGAFLVLYYLVRRRWQLFTVAVSCTALLNVVAVLYLYLCGASWLQDYLNNARGFVTVANKIDSFTTENPSRFTLINLQVPFFSITGDSHSSNLWALAICGLLVCSWLNWVVKQRDTAPELLSLGAISAIALLPVYHRFYDAAILILPLCWCITTAHGPSKKIVRAAIFLIGPFLLPGAALLQQFAVRGQLPATVANSWWWNCVIMPHETWSLLALSLVLLYGIKTSQINGPSQTFEARPEEAS